MSLGYYLVLRVLVGKFPTDTGSICPDIMAGRLFQSGRVP